MSFISKVRKVFRTLSGFDRVWWHALRMGIAPGFEHLRVPGLMKTRSLVDISANRSHLTLAARHCYPSAEIHSFQSVAGSCGEFPSCISRRRSGAFAQVDH